MHENPQVVLVFSGKRKSGKDYVTDMVHSRLGADKSSLIRLSGPLKGQYAVEHGLDGARLLNASEYKEKYRVDMIRWGEERRNRDPGYFCRLATSAPELGSRPVWIVTDARRKTDLAYFREMYSQRAIFVRTLASEEVRKERGWRFTTGVDDAESECDLDEGITFDLCIRNDNDSSVLESDIDRLMSAIHILIDKA